MLQKSNGVATWKTNRDINRSNPIKKVYVLAEMSSCFKIKASHVHIMTRCSLKSKQYLIKAWCWWQRLKVLCMENCKKSEYFSMAWNVWLAKLFLPTARKLCVLGYHNYAVVWVQHPEIVVQDNHLEPMAEMTVPCNPRVPADVIWPPTCPQVIWRHLQVLRVSTHPNSLWRGISSKLKAKPIEREANFLH